MDSDTLRTQGVGANAQIDARLETIDATHHARNHPMSSTQKCEEEQRLTLLDIPIIKRAFPVTLFERRTTFASRPTRLSR